MPLNRRQWLAGTLAAAGAAAPSKLRANNAPRRRHPNRIAVSTYSYWRYRKDSRLPIEDCIDLAAEAGFDGVEILHVQMH